MKKRQNNIGDRLYFLVYALFFFLVVVPVIYTFGHAFFEGQFSTNFAELLNRKTFFLLGKSIAVSFVIAFFSSGLGVILGFLLYRTNVLYRDFFKVALLIPLFISPYILAVAWKDFFFLAVGHSSFIFSYVGVILVLTMVFTPLSMLIIGNALTSINAQIEEAGLMLTHFWRVLFKIILPLIQPAILSSFLLVFIFSISEFSVPAFFGVKLFTTEIFTQFSAFYNHSLAILQSALLIFICLFLLFSERNYISNASFIAIGNKGNRHAIYNIKKNGWGFTFLIGWGFLSIIFPLVILFIEAFKDGTNSFLKAFDLLRPTFASSFGLAFLGAFITIIIGFIASYVSVYQIDRHRVASFDWLLLIAFAIPSTIFGISLIKFFNQPLFSFIYSSYAIILIGYVGKFSFISTKLISNAMRQIPNSLNESAQIADISFVARLQKILLPLIMPALFAAFVITFIFCLSELGTTIMLYPPGTEIMTIKVFTIMANAPQALVSSMTLIVFGIILFFIFGVYFLSKKYFYIYNNK